MINPSRSDFLIEVNRRRGFDQIKKGGLIWYTDGSKTETGAGVCCHGKGENLVLALGNMQEYSRHVQLRM
jgi:hypothetical protein